MSCPHPYTTRSTDGITLCLSCEQYLNSLGVPVDMATLLAATKAAKKPKRKFTRPLVDDA